MLGPLLMQAEQAPPALLRHLVDVADDHANITGADPDAQPPQDSAVWRLVASTPGDVPQHAMARASVPSGPLFAVVEAPTPGPLTGVSAPASFVFCV